VCAPSNGALDEIVGRLLATGLTDSRGRLYAPRLVRVGVSVHHSVAAVSLERLVAERMERAAQVWRHQLSSTKISFELDCRS
jgi:senataxin